CQQHNKYPLTF
nr:immunoglobulin light chain junction region [Macaca mulatta]MOX48509.1 immunoglobulin light chain junction region [Macaca mulatta]MOX49300.1 immunoglobulin light chain junction region [Macaca mulatta]MOX49939.1 immunoglobulin light chain junction region [Macaca mulatta]MOX50890.1 immunoglobulin light chain junction region [Macaca mulatta]